MFNKKRHFKEKENKNIKDGYIFRMLALNTEYLTGQSYEGYDDFLSATFIVKVEISHCRLNIRHAELCNYWPRLCSAYLVSIYVCFVRPTVRRQFHVWELNTSNYCATQIMKLIS
jgi:hypothetical protein